MAPLKLRGIPSKLACADWKPMQSAADAAIKAKRFFFIIFLPVSADEDKVSKFLFGPTFGSNAAFAESDLLTISSPLIPVAAASFLSIWVHPRQASCAGTERKPRRPSRRLRKQTFSWLPHSPAHHSEACPP